MLFAGRGTRLVAERRWAMLTADQYRKAEFGYSLAESRHGFKVHATIYAVVMIGLIVLNAALIAYTDANFPWAIFPLVGWGIGLTFHYIYGYRRAGVRIDDRHRRIEEYAEASRSLNDQRETPDQIPPIPSR
jgi:hypothetical protein